MNDLSKYPFGPVLVIFAGAATIFGFGVMLGIWLAYDRRDRDKDRE